MSEKIVRNPPWPGPPPEDDGCLVTDKELIEELAATLAEAHALMQEVAEWLNMLRLNDERDNRRYELVTKMFHHLTHKAERLNT
jgi:hypothetical protein